MTKKSFLLYHDTLKVLDFMTDEQAGLLFRAIKDYQNGIDPVLDNTLSLVFIPFKNQFDRENKNYEKTCERNRSNAKKSQSQPLAASRSHSPPVATDTDTDTETKKETVTKKDTSFYAGRSKKTVAEYNREVLKELEEDA